ncbi:unnamed protein product [Prorocentrum cordatum]|uniref:PDZ domain-containing protein n=1 Tax=Prorocentrum cordatum TaxID=2364126 RepID=A0ABN9SRH8_9DINO|nr:unnamed protein product [Polarella glacialis]
MGNACCADGNHDNAEAVIEQRSKLSDETANQPVQIPGKKLENTNAAKSELPGTEFTMVIDKTTGRKLGVDVDHQDGCTLQVDAVTGGLFQQWNDNHPEQAVKPGDRIVEVNGLRNDVQLLVEECRQNKLLELVVKRGP